MNRNLMNELKEGIEALAERKDLEEWAFYGSGLVAHGCLENIDEYMREAITKYGRLLLSKQRIKAEILEEELEYYRGVAEQLGAEKAVSQRDKMLEEFHQIEQILGKALGYPWYKDDLKNFPDATEADGVCIAPNTAASLAMHAADKIKMLDIREQDKQKIIDSQEEDLETLKKQNEQCILMADKLKTLDKPPVKDNWMLRPLHNPTED